MTITNHLVSERGFTRIPKNKSSETDINKYSCLKRIGDIHYLFYSECMKYFSLVVQYERKKGKAGGGYDTANQVMIPRLIKSVSDADQLLLGITGSLNKAL